MKFNFLAPANILFTMVGLLCSYAVANDVVITPDSDLEEINKTIVAGDNLILTDGVWKDAELLFESLPGTEASPIHIRPQNSGKVIFTGETTLRLSGSYVVLSGFVFRDITETSDVVQMRTHSLRHAHNCRITDCVFEQTPDSAPGIESKWLSVFGTKNRVDHCYFAGKKSRGPTLIVWVDDTIGDNRIDHNHFGPRPELGQNGAETIRIGTSEVSMKTSRTTVEDNYFNRCNGEAEIISSKTCENIFRRNVFEQCSGSLTLRHGDRCTVDGNVFLGAQKPDTGGVRIVGREHVVTNNYFDGLRGESAQAAICMMNGAPKAALNGYAPVSGVTVAHNTFVDCKDTLNLGYKAGKKRSAAPADSTVSGNLFLPGQWPLFKVNGKPTGFVWEGNLHQSGTASDKEQLVQFERRDLKLAKGPDGLMRPADSEPLITKIKPLVDKDIDGDPRGENVLAGCDEPVASDKPTEWPNAKNTGPTWLETSQSN